MPGSGQPTNEHPPQGISRREVDTIGINAAFTFLATVLVILRFFSRKISVAPRLWWDDWTILLSLLAAIAFFVLVVVNAIVGGNGYHIQTYSREQLSTYYQLYLALIVVYVVSISLSKASVLLLYKRMFSVDRRIHMWIKIMLVLILAYFLASAVGLIFTTNPVEAQWKYWLPHTTIHTKEFYLVMGIANPLFDVVILCIPQFIVWKLHKPWSSRLLLSFIFLLGSFVCIVSILRIISIMTIDTTDSTYTYHGTTIWSIVEMNVSIICACLPVLSRVATLTKQKLKSIAARFQRYMCEGT
ncbi:hypothetical protein F5Y02DRAFT_424493 [Annulohypoxylon stygium]|nr:hypothetical protein F5Y02DRAFT_424493 [Annulohypoxylon stygium]